jgi:hypothetical protein
MIKPTRSSVMVMAMSNTPHVVIIRKRQKMKKTKEKIAFKETTSLNCQLLLPLQIPSYDPTYRLT